VALQLTQKSVRQFVETVSDQHHAMAGAVIAAAAAQAAALAEACMQISLDNQVDKLDWNQVTGRIEQMVYLKNSLLEWCDQDAIAINEYVALREAGAALSGQRILCDGPAEIGRICAEAVTILQNFRGLVFERVKDDLEMALTLLAGAAQAAMLLLDSNLRLWPEPELLKEYEPLRRELEAQIKQFTPVARIRPTEA
jgi:formiminotetrahydrofolate cyclodeaminase